MITPVNPQDHTLNGGTIEKFMYHESERAVSFVAVVEAIRQCFERDALPRICGSCGDLARRGSISCEAMDAGDYSAVCCMGVTICDGRQCDLAPDECDHHDHIDPDTEIDRIARLIVDGEYRRRGATTTTEGENV